MNGIVRELVAGDQLHPKTKETVLSIKGSKSK
jgi:hypothetical protein